MITVEDVKGLMTECLSMSDGLVEIDLDSPVVIDSFTLVWILHLMEERHGIVIAPEQADFPSTMTVREFHGYLAATFPDRVSVER
uniref:Putative acyl carrier protein n=1 Tax=Amycolatopsis sp. SANK 60206 TaxID=1642649 RepID=A0A0E3Z7K6_9PSEU|nr:putative acyl carrier protein [Amycolatopsis sp. SANK 60206]